MHPEAREWVETHLPDNPESVVEFGSRDVNGIIRDLLPDGCSYIGVDIAEGPNVDVLADAATVELDPVDVVVCCETLEHASRPRSIVHNAARLLKPGGRLIITAAGLGRTPHGQHGADRPVDGEYYRNVNPHMLEGWLVGGRFSTFQVVAGRSGADVYAVADK